MRKISMGCLPRANSRAAFTLIELLVVIAIIAALMALSASAVIKFLSSQEEANTRSTLDKVQSQLNKAWSKVKDQANSSQESVPAGVLALAGTDPNATGRARVIYVKLKWRQAFPMSFAEALNLSRNNTALAAWGLPSNVTTPVPVSPLPALPAYATYLSNLGITPGNLDANGHYTIPGRSETSANYESSICLLMALQRGVSGAGVNPEELTRGGATGSLPTPSGGSIPYLTDAWGRPICFSRFPAGCPMLNPTGAQSGINDPGDPQGHLNFRDLNLWPQSSRNTFFALALQQPATGNNISYKLAPLVASGGPTNWIKAGTPPGFDPITFAPTAGSTALFSSP